MSENGGLAAIRLDVTFEGMRAAMMNMLQVRHAEIQGEAEDAFRGAVERFDMRTCIDREMHRHIHEVFEAAVRRAIWDVFRDDSVQEALRRSVAKSIGVEDV